MHINLHKTFSTLHGGWPCAGPPVLSEALAKFAALPFVKKEGERFRLIETAAEAGPERSSFGRVKGFHGQFGVMIRALAYAMALGKDGLHQASGDPVLNANYTCSPGVRRGADRAIPGAVHARGAVRRRFLQGYRCHHPRFRQGAGRRRLPPDDHVLSAGDPRGAADRAHRNQSKQTLDVFIDTVTGLAAKARAGEVEFFHAAIDAAAASR